MAGRCERCAATARRGKTSRNRGHAVVETAFMIPWLFFLFVGVLDFGFYMYAAMSVENAARVAALQTSRTSAGAGDSTAACQEALPELQKLPNVGTSVTSCGALPVIVSATALAAASSADGLAAASRVTVTYQGPNMIPIPGLLMGRLNLTRSVEMRVQE